MADVLVFIEQRNGVIKKFSLEALTQGRIIAHQTSGKLAAVMVGTPEAASALQRYGADRIYFAHHPVLEAYSTEGFAEVLVAASRLMQPSVFLASASSMGKDLLPRVSARLGVAMAQDCTALHCSGDGRLKLVRPIFAGKALATVSLKGTPQVATLRPNVFALKESTSDSVYETVDLAPYLKLDTLRARVVGTKQASGQTVELTEADIIVSGGRGIRGPEHFHLVQELADVLGAAVGASRAVVDAGWAEHRIQVGQTGKTVSPTLYVACGISGAIQHLAGMSSSKHIIAINKDAEAPIFKVAEYGIVGDLFQVLPALTEELKKFKNQSVG